MMTLFDQERAIELYARSEKAEGKVEGINEGVEIGVEKGIRAMVSALRQIALAPAAIAQTLVEQFGLSQDAAEQKVRQYWT